MKIPRILLAAGASGSGKTTVTMALLSALKKKGVDLAAFKTGPDYIDPMFHTEVLGIPCRNLDLFLTGEAGVRELLVKNRRDFQVLEGVMGYYDGIAKGTNSSSYHLAKVTETPVILVVQPKGMAITAAAVVQGIKDFRTDSNIKGVILNGVTKMMYPYYRDLITGETGLSVFGYLPHLENCEIGSRHLGLISAGEIETLGAITDSLGEAALETLDLDGILALGQEAPDLWEVPGKVEPVADVVLAVAKDRAFNFYYEDSLSYLEELGVKRRYFSPLGNEEIPKEAHGLYLGGGYPEHFMDLLSKNDVFLHSLRKAFRQKMPMIAECGGFMVLQEGFKGEKTFSLAGIFPGTCEMTRRLQNFGYIHLSSQEDSLLLRKGESIPAHEFHYSKSENPGSFFHAVKPESSRSWDTGYAGSYYYAGYPHLHLYGKEGAKRFVKKMEQYKEEVWQRH